MLLDTLNKISKPETLKEIFASNEQSVLFDRLTASLREAANGIKEQLKSDLDKIVADKVQEAEKRIKVPRDGDTPVKGVHYFDGKTPIKGIDYSDGKDAVIDEAKIIEEILKKIPSQRIPMKHGGGGGGGSTIVSEDLSSQVTGATRTFTTTRKIGVPILLVSSQFPHPFRLTTDYTAVTNTVTMDSATDFIASGQTLIFIFAAGD